MSTRISPLPRGTALSRYVRAVAQAKGDKLHAIEIARGWVDVPEVRLTLERKIATTPMAAGEDDSLASYGIAGQFVEMFREASIVGRLASRMNLTDFRVSTPVEGSGVAASWVGESDRKPVKIGSLENVTLEPFQAAVICVVSDELVRASSPAAESAVRRILVNALSAHVDSGFLSSAAASASSPGGIGASQQTQSSSGSSLANIQGDLSTMATKLTSWTDPVWITHPAVMVRLGALGMLSYPGPILAGLPVYATRNSPSQIMLVDLGSILIAEGPANIDLARSASVKMDDGQSPETEINVNLWQDNLIGLRAERYTSWRVGHGAGVVVMAVNFS